MIRKNSWRRGRHEADSGFAGGKKDSIYYCAGDQVVAAFFPRRKKKHPRARAPAAKESRGVRLFLSWTTAPRRPYSRRP